MGKLVIKSAPSLEAIRNWAASAVRDAVSLPLSGEEKREQVVARLVEVIDAALVFGPGPVGRLAEWGDGRIAALILRPLVHEVYERLKRDGDL